MIEPGLSTVKANHHANVGLAVTRQFSIWHLLWKGERSP